MIGRVILFIGGMVMVFDENGQQLPDYQGWASEVSSAILADAPPECRFSFGKFREGGFDVTRGEWAALARPMETGR